MSIARVVKSYTTKRIILSSPKPFSRVIAALDKEINKDGPHIKDVMYGVKSKEDFDKGVSAVTDNGTKPFAYFTADYHSKWLSVYFGRKIQDMALYTFGNPMYAKDLMTIDPVTGMELPPRVLVQSTEDGGTRIHYELPSSWYIENPSPELKAELEDLDGKLDRTMKKILS
ncbi:DUF302 domain-containing protein [Phanerochaete sordida]|uniref:DUF302 domain-containing protein n=1 Tax=Phanerochaete sordida TaxID=48140 RepID=A0A9P3G925_9APHY|nr:DUF302 domain-containing protein [Phanerochaete sordida]